MVRAIERTPFYKACSGTRLWRSFSFSISSSNEYSGLISFRMDWLDLFAVQGSFPLRRGLTPRVSLECNPEIHVAPGWGRCHRSPWEPLGVPGGQALPTG